LSHIAPLGIAFERGDRSQQLAPVADRGHANADQVVGGQLRQHVAIDIIFAEGSPVLF
jgi:hypothetical protein